MEWALLSGSSLPALMPARLEGPAGKGRARPQASRRHEQLGAATWPHLPPPAPRPGEAFRNQGAGMSSVRVQQALYL